METDVPRVQLFPDPPQVETEPVIRTHESHSQTQPYPAPSPGPMTQMHETPPRNSDAKRTRSPTHSETSSSFHSMASLLARSTSPTYPHNYDPENNPKYVYRDNGDGSLFCIGLAQPTDFYPDGSLRGPQPSELENENAMMQLEQALNNSPLRPFDPSSEPIPRSPSPVETLATQDETEASSITSTLKGQPSPTPEERLPVTGPLPSLPAEEAKTEHA